jgi:hypothetical protein
MGVKEAEENSKLKTIFLIQMHQCSRQMEPLWSLHEGIGFCHLGIVSDFVLRYSDFQRKEMHWRL